MFDFNGNKEWENDFFESIENGDIQHIKCTIKRLDGVMLELDENNLLD